MRLHTVKLSRGSLWVPCEGGQMTMTVLWLRLGSPSLGNSSQSQPSLAPARLAIAHHIYLLLPPPRRESCALTHGPANTPTNFIFKDIKSKDMEMIAAAINPFAGINPSEAEKIINM